MKLILFTLLSLNVTSNVLNKLFGSNTVWMILEGSFTMNKTVDSKIIIFIIGIHIKIVKFGVLEYIPVNIVSIHMKSSMTWYFWWVRYIIELLIDFRFSLIKYTGIPIHTWGEKNMGEYLPFTRRRGLHRKIWKALWKPKKGNVPLMGKDPLITTV